MTSPLEHILPSARALPKVDPIPLSERERQSYSLANAIKAAFTGNWKNAGFERALTMTALQAMDDADTSVNRLIVPPSVLADTRRDLVAGTGAAGGFLVNTRIEGVIDALAPKLVVARLGARLVTGLRSNITYARAGTQVTTSWQATEAASTTETQDLQLGQVALTPKTVAALIEESRLFQLLASSASDAMVRRALAVGLATAVDAAALNGTGASGQPSGLLNVPGIGTFNGASITYANLMEAQTDVLSANGLSDGGRVAFACRPAVASVLAQRQGFNASSPPCWVGPLDEGLLVGCPAISTVGVPAATLIAGDWSRMMLAEWGPGLDVRVNPVADFVAGKIALAAFLTVDVSVEWPASFSVATSVS
jgi:HK97 family phage major capsid protein